MTVFPKDYCGIVMVICIILVICDIFLKYYKGFMSYLCFQIYVLEIYMIIVKNQCTND